MLVVHPFADTIRAQYQKRGELFTNAPGGVNTLPELASLTVIPAVQGLAGQKPGMIPGLMPLPQWKTDGCLRL